MSAHAYIKDQLVEQPAIGLVVELGWTTVSASEEILAAKRADAGTATLLDSRAQEAEIDRHVYALYPPSLDELRRTRALTPAEIKIVEEAAR